MKIVPTFDNIAVLLDKAEAISRGGIALPSTATPGNITGVVHAVGPCLTIDLEVGDRVLLADDAKGAGVLTPENRTVLVLSSEHVLAAIKD